MKTKHYSGESNCLKLVQGRVKHVDQVYCM